MTRTANRIHTGSARSGRRGVRFHMITSIVRNKYVANTGILRYSLARCNAPAPRELPEVGGAALFQTDGELCPFEEGNAVAWGAGKAGVVRAMYHFGVGAKLVNSMAATSFAGRILPCKCLRVGISFRIDATGWSFIRLERKLA